MEGVVMCIFLLLGWAKIGVVSSCEGVGRSVERGDGDDKGDKGKVCMRRSVWWMKGEVREGGWRGDGRGAG